MKKLIRNVDRAYFEQKISELSPPSCLRRRCLHCNKVIPSNEVISKDGDFFHVCAGELTQLVLNVQSPVWEHECEKYWGAPLEILWRQFNYWLDKQEQSDSDNIESLIDFYVQLLVSERSSGGEVDRKLNVNRGLWVAVLAIIIIGGIVFISFGLQGIAKGLEGMSRRREEAAIVASTSGVNAVENRIVTEYDKEKKVLQDWVDEGNFPTREQVEHYKLKVPNDQYWEWNKEKNK